MVFTEDNVEFQSQNDFNKMEAFTICEANNESMNVTSSSSVYTVIKELSLKSRDIKQLETNLTIESVISEKFADHYKSNWKLHIFNHEKNDLEIK